MDIIASQLADAARLMRRDFDARARGIGVTRTQWQVLIVLSRNEGINQGGLADLLEVEPITVCRMIDRLQDADLIERRADPSDRRSWRLFLTAKARDLLAILRPHAEAMVENALNGIDVKELEIMTRLLERIRQNLTRRSAVNLADHG